MHAAFHLVGIQPVLLDDAGFAEGNEPDQGKPVQFKGGGDAGPAQGAPAVVEDDHMLPLDGGESSDCVRQAAEPSADFRPRPPPECADEAVFFVGQQDQLASDHDPGKPDQSHEQGDPRMKEDGASHSDPLGDPVQEQEGEGDLEDHRGVAQKNQEEFRLPDPLADTRPVEFLDAHGVVQGRSFLPVGSHHLIHAGREV